MTCDEDPPQLPVSEHTHCSSELEAAEEILINRNQFDVPVLLHKMSKLVYAKAGLSADSWSADLRKSTDVYEEIYINVDATETRSKERPTTIGTFTHSCL